MPPETPEVAELLGQVNDLTHRYKSGTPDALRAWKDLATLLLRVTVADERFGLRLFFRGSDRTRASLGGLGADPTAAIPLRGGRFLRATMKIGLATERKRNLDNGREEELRRLKVFASAFQYQADAEGRDWIFRFDYLRLDLLRTPAAGGETSPAYRYPECHLQVRGGLAAEGLLAPGRNLSDIHFPTRRIPLEAVLRLLIDDFGVPAATPEPVWRRVLEQSERLFKQIAHDPGAPPAA